MLLKIMMLTDYYYPHEGGGVEKVVLEVSERLRKLGSDIIILTLNTKKTFKFENHEGIKVYRVNCIDLTEKIGIQLSVSLEAIFEIARVCKEENPDILHANNRFFFTTLCAAILKGLLKRPLVMTAHLGPMAFGKGWQDFVIRAYERTISSWIFRRSECIIAVSGAVKQHVVNLGVEPDKVKIIPNGVDLRNYVPLQKRLHCHDQRVAKKVVSVGRLIQNKGIHYLIDAAPEVLQRFPSTEFIIVGDGPMRTELETRAKERGVLQAFRFYGFVPEVSNVLNTCDIFVRPSLTEGMPLAVLEAMACGLPVIATRVAGTPEIVIDHETGILVDSGDASNLAEALIELLGNTELAMRFGVNARKLVEKSHSWQKTARMTLNVYKEILKNRAYR
jgi:glycosyltransferase involved in cell wall biosynthesis